MQNNKSNSKKNISFLLGAGFSVPMGLPNKEVLGKRICDAKNNFAPLSDMEIYAKEYHEKYKMIYDDKWNFLCDLIDCYLEKTIFFDYEEFYDYLRDSENQREFNVVFLKHNSDEFESVSSYVEAACILYQNLIAKLLMIALDEDDIKQYNNFVLLLRWCLARYDYVNVFTLNHDLVFELICKVFFKNLYSDGFENGAYVDRGTGELIENYRGFYQRKIRFVKLHGSIDYYTTLENYNESLVKLKTYSQKQNLFGLKSNKYEGYDMTPFFLTGKNKSILYNQFPYCTFITNFEKEIDRSVNLIIIGYSGNDNEINEKIKARTKRRSLLFVSQHASRMRKKFFLCKYYNCKIEDISVRILLTKLEKL